MKPAGRQDQELLARIAARDPEAAGQLFDRYCDEISRYLARRLRPQDVEDRLQEVFVRVLRSASRFRGDAEVRSWLYGIARNVLREQRRDRLDPRSFVELVDRAPGPHSLTLAGETHERLLGALEALPDEQAIVLELHRLDGLDHSEIGALLRIRPATSRKRLQRALRALHRGLRGRGAASHPHHQGFESWRRSLRRRTLEAGSPS